MPNSKLAQDFRNTVNSTIKEFGRYLEAVESAISEDSEGGCLVTERERQRIESREKVFEETFMDLMDIAKEFR